VGPIQVHSEVNGFQLQNPLKTLSGFQLQNPLKTPSQTMMSYMLFIFLVCSSLAAATDAVSKDHPIGGVISLLQKLMIEAKEEGETESANYQKFTYWCKRSTRKLKMAIKKENKHIVQFTDQIEGLKKEIETLTFDIETLTTQIEEQETQGTVAAERRQNETDLYTKTYKNLDDTIVAVDDAIEVMEVAQVKSQEAKMFLALKHNLKKNALKWSPPPAEEAEATAVAGELDALNSMSAVRASKWQNSDQKLEKSVTGLIAATKKLKKVEKVDSHELPGEYAHINLNPGAKNPFKKNKVKVYTEHEGEVIETFEDMEGDLEHDKLDVHQREANAQNAYELAKKSRDFAIGAAKDNKKEKEDIKGDKEAELAKAETDLSAEESELAGDSATLDSTDQECKTVNEGWEQRSSIRAGEIEAMEMAIKILSKVSGVRNPDTHEIPAKALAQVSLLQIDSSPNGSAKAKAVALLREAGKSHHNGALQKLANTIMAFDGPFDKIKAMIQKMTFRLQAEQKDEDDHKNWCDLELQKNQDITDDKTEKIDMTKIEITELDSELKITIKAIVENNEKLSDIETYMAQETQLREENKAEIELTIKDAVAGAEAVTQAITVLKDFYKESGMIAKEPWEFIQTSKASKSAGVTLPDKPSTWDASYTGVTDPESGSDGVLGILEGVSTKFATMESDAKLQDATDQKSYDKDMASKKVEIADVTSDTQMKESKKQSLQEKLDAASAKLKHLTSENDAVLQYLKDLKPACAPGEGSYEDRKQARTDEITALRKAQTILEDAFRAK